VSSVTGLRFSIYGDALREGEIIFKSSGSCGTSQSAVATLPLVCSRVYYESMATCNQEGIYLESVIESQVLR